MPRYVNTADQGDSSLADQYDLSVVADESDQYQTETTWLSKRNSYNGTLKPNQVWLGKVDDIRDWEKCFIRINTNAGINTIEYTSSMDGGKTFPFSDVCDTSRTLFQFPLAAQYGRLSVTAGSSAVLSPTTVFQIAVIYKRSIVGETSNGLPMVSTDTPFNILQSSTQALNVRVVNDWQDDWIRGLCQGRTTGFIAGYCDNVDTNFQSLTNIASGSIATPTMAGASNVFMASSNVQDSYLTGNGAGVYFVAMMDTTFTLFFEVILLTGTTPVAVGLSSPTGTVYRILAAFLVTGGPNFTNAIPYPNANKGIIYIGVGAFSTATGFATNYGVNRIGDGTLVVPIYTVPKGKWGLLYQLKYGADGANPITYRTFGKDSATGPWQLIIEDVATTTIQPTRSLVGGWKRAGAEWHVMGKRRGSSALGNVIGAIIEIDETLLQIASGVIQY